MKVESQVEFPFNLNVLGNLFQYTLKCPSRKEVLIIWDCGICPSDNMQKQWDAALSVSGNDSSYWEIIYFIIFRKVASKEPIIQVEWRMMIIHNDNRNNKN